MSATAVRLMTAEEFLALPNEGTDRTLIRGELREKPMAYRNRFHSRLTSRLSQLLGNWSDSQPEPRGLVFDGDVGCRFSNDADSVVGIDVAYWTAEQLSAQSEESNVLAGPPTLAVEILSPSNTIEEIDEKIGLYLHQGVRLVWVVDPYDRTVTIYQPDKEPAFANIDGELTGENVLPGFRVAVKAIFA